MALKDSFTRVRRPTGRRRLLAAMLVPLAAASATAGALVWRDADESQKRIPEAARGEPRVGVSFLARLIPPKAERRRPAAGTPHVARSVEELARRLPLERKVAQLFLLGFTGTDLNAEIFRRLQRLDIGGIVIARANYTDPSLLGQLAGEAYVVSRQARKVPPWVMATQEGGEFNSFPDLPPARAPADLPSAAEAATEASQSAAALRPLSVTGVLGPVVDVGLESDPLGGRAFSDDPDEVAAFAAATIDAYRRGHMLAAVEHFPGLGSASASTEEAPATVGLSLGELARRDLAPFRTAFRVGAPAVVLSHAFYAPDDFTVPGSLSRKIIVDLLRRRLRFRGLAITDDLADPPITSFSSVPDAAVKALRAGADILYISGPASDQSAAYVAVLRAVQSGRVRRSRLDEAVLRILEAKRDYGLIR
jgi:beta-N-acetylhexosaminidase